MVEGDTGADLADVPVHRGADVATTAAQLSARAYTSAGEIHLPDEHGPLSAGPARSLLAHELTHVAQQRALGSALPPEDSVAGAQLEAEAEATEHAASRAEPQRSPLVSPVARRPRDAGTRPGELPLAPQRAPAPQRLAGPTLAADPSEAAVAAGVAVPGPGGTVHFQPPGGGVHVVPPADRVQRAVEIDDISADMTGPTAAAEEGAEDDEGDLAAEEQELDSLARRLWPRIHERLRGDLLVARERAGELVERF